MRYHFQTITSTNDWVKGHIEEFAVDAVTLVTAGEQTAGRGRFKRKWISPINKNIYATFCFFVPEERKDIGNIPQLLALSVIAVLKDAGFSPTLKWPNDILLAGKKLAGILCETVVQEASRGVVLGIGLNVNMSQEELDSVGAPSTSLLHASGKLYDIEELIKKIEDHFVGKLTVFLREGFAPFYSEFLQLNKDILNKKISIQTPTEKIEGVLSSVNDDGSLMILQGKNLRRVYSGELI